jgi:hypothetical protein
MFDEQPPDPGLKVVPGKCLGHFHHGRDLEADPSLEIDEGCRHSSSIVPNEVTASHPWHTSLATTQIHTVGTKKWKCRATLVLFYRLSLYNSKNEYLSLQGLPS